MPGKVKVKIIAGKNLPVMDRSSDTTDAYVEIKLGTTTYKTEVCRKSLNPQWNSDWYRFEVDDSELQDEPLQIRLMDHDTYSANDAIGKVYVDLNPLLLPSVPAMSKTGWSGDSSKNGEHYTNSLLSGWFPVYDTMHGIRGEVNIMVKVELFSDFNKFRQSSCGVHFFCSQAVPHGYAIHTYHGFLEELIVNDDPEYQWIDKIRTPRASNEARQTLFFKLAGALQRRIGVKALELGGNAVIGYSQCFDLEGELGVVVRGVGTAVTLMKLRNVPPLTILETNNEEQALNYLQFLRCDRDFHLNHNYLNNNSNNICCPKSFNSDLKPDNNDITVSPINQKILTRHLSYNNEFTTTKSSPTLNQNPLDNTRTHSCSLQTLLHQEDLRGIPEYSIAKKLKNFKNSSQNMLSKKVIALKAKLSDSGMQEEDDGEIDVNLQGVSKKQHFFHSRSTDSNPLAEVLVRSIMCSSLDFTKQEDDDLSLSEAELSLNINSSSSSDEDDNISDECAKINLETVSGIIKNIINNSNVIPEQYKTKSESNQSSDGSNSSKLTDCEGNLAPLATFDEYDVSELNLCHSGVSGSNHGIRDTADNEEKSIIRSMQMNDNSLKNQSLTETAMKLILLDKVNLMGTYNSPSPSKSFNLEQSNKAILKKDSKVLSDIYKAKVNCNLASSVPVDPAYNNKLSDNFIKPVSLKPPVDAELDKFINNMHASLALSRRTIASPATELNKNDCGHQRTESVGAKTSQSPGRFQTVAYMNRRSSDSDLSITPKGNSLTGSDKLSGVHNPYISRIGPVLHPAIPQNNIEMLEYPFMTISKFPSGFITYLGGVVSARSVKLLERITNLDEPESRDTWWTELRMEIRSHMRSLHCNAVLAYTETSSICDDVCVLSACGTAAVIHFQNSEEISDGISGLPNIVKQSTGTKDIMASSLDRSDFERERILQKQDMGSSAKPLSESPEKEVTPNFVNTISPCTICHLPYTNSSVPFRTISSKCGFCQFGKVPEVLMATMEIPDAIPSIGRGCFVQAYVCRPLKDLRSELNAKDISDGLPFLEYELHRLLVNKIRVKGMNAVFGLGVRISVGTKMLVGIATGTGVFLLPLPSPPLPKLVSIGSINDKQLIKMQQHLHDTIQANKEVYQLKLNDTILNSRLSPDTDQNEEEQSFLDISLESRDCCILEVDDSEDKEIMELLREPPPPDGFHVINTEIIPGLEEMEIIKNLQMFTQIWRSKVYPSYNFGMHISKLLQSVYFKLRRMVPCALCNLKFRIDLPEPDEIQITVLGMALELRKSLKSKRKNIHVPIKESTHRTDDDMMFNLEEDVTDSNVLNVQPIKSRMRSPFRNPTNTAINIPHREKHSIDITPLSYVPNGRIERYLGNLNFFFIRETTSIREEGGLSGFIHTFVAEVLAIVRAHIAALGGNAMVAYYMTECVFSHSLNKNQGQCLINVGGDVVFVSYFPEE